MRLRNQLATFSEANLQRWLFLRAIEWTNWPSFVSQPVVPILFVFLPWLYVVAGVLCMDLFWSMVRYKYVNVSAAYYAVYFVSVAKWPMAIGSAIFLLIHHRVFVGLLSIAWPLGLSGFIIVPGQVGWIELRFAHEIGYVHEGNEDNGLSDHCPNTSDDPGMAKVEESTSEPEVTCMGCGQDHDRIELCRACGWCVDCRHPCHGCGLCVQCCPMLGACPADPAWFGH